MDVSNRLPSVGVIFDMDGVVLDTSYRGYTIMQLVFQKSGMKAPSFAEFVQHFRDPYLQFYRERGILQSEKSLRAVYEENHPHRNPPLFDDFKPTSQALIAEHNACLGLISSNSARVVDDACTLHRLRESIGSFVYAERTSKIAAIADFCEDYGLLPQNVLFVGDMATDMEDGMAAGVIPVGITRGHDVSHVLSSAGAKHCISHLDELFEVLLKENLIQHQLA